MNDEKIGFVYDKVNISITVYQVRMTHAREYSKMCLLSNLILEQGVNRIHLGLAFLFRMTGDQITKVKLTNVSEILVQACFQFIEPTAYAMSAYHH
jgi:hypothetical protein